MTVDDGYRLDVLHPDPAVPDDDVLRFDFEVPGDVFISALKLDD